MAPRTANLRVMAAVASVLTLGGAICFAGAAAIALGTSSDLLGTVMERVVALSAIAFAVGVATGGLVVAIAAVRGIRRLARYLLPRSRAVAQTRQPPGGR